jgi:hypothetical protein
MEKLMWHEIFPKILLKHGQSFIDYIIAAEKYDSLGGGRNEKEITEMFENWWNSWQEADITELEENWHCKRGAYVMLQLAYLEIKKKRLDIEIITTKDRKTVQMIEGDTLDLINRGSGETDIFLEYQPPTLTIKNANVVKKERKETSK